jgi:hypothetical protein
LPDPEAGDSQKQKDYSHNREKYPASPGQLKPAAVFGYRLLF